MHRFQANLFCALSGSLRLRSTAAAAASAACRFHSTSSHQSTTGAALAAPFSVVSVESTNWMTAAQSSPHAAAALEADTAPIPFASVFSTHEALAAPPAPVAAQAASDAATDGTANDSLCRASPPQPTARHPRRTKTRPVEGEASAAAGGVSSSAVATDAVTKKPRRPRKKAEQTAALGGESDVTPKPKTKRSRRSARSATSAPVIECPGEELSPATTASDSTNSLSVLFDDATVDAEATTRAESQSAAQRPLTEAAKAAAELEAWHSDNGAEHTTNGTFTTPVTESTLDKTSVPDAEVSPAPTQFIAT